jgi:AraC family transcriptional regulator of adaptative response/methylated-DNA-[protein]-cysteine methyltransferase
VLREDGHLGGYKWGIERKRALIDFERRQRGGAGFRDGGQCVLEL